MKHLLSNAGRAFLKAFLASLLVVAIGLTSQKTLHGALLIGIAGLMASLAAGLAAIQTFIPRISFRAYLPDPWGPIVDSFFHAAVGAFVVAITGWLAEPNYTVWRAALIAAVVGAINAGLRAIQGALTPGELPGRAHGITTPAVPPGYRRQPGPRV